jgi:DNA ligase-associated metallophosphoesterase
MLAAPVHISCAGQSIRLLPQRCAFWEERGALLLSDLHLGKSATFRHHGIALPEGDTAADLARLDSALAETEAESIIIVGDLFHAASSRSATVMALFADWRARHPELLVQLVIGNHDRGALPPHNCDIVLVSVKYDTGELCFIHDPADITDEAFSICGHLHPVITLPGGNGKISAPCFWHAPRKLVLPSFGGFTGGPPLRPQRDSTYYALAEGRVLPVPGPLLFAS